MPELDEKNINLNRHRFCHLIPKKLQDKEIDLEVHIEVRVLDLKLFKGFDFEFGEE